MLRQPTLCPSTCFLAGGIVNQNTNLFNNAGNNGIYWSSTPNSNGTSAYDLYFNGTTNINPSDNYNRQNGLSVRCLYPARSPPNQNHSIIISWA